MMGRKYKSKSENLEFSLNRQNRDPSSRLLYPTSTVRPPSMFRFQGAPQHTPFTNYSRPHTPSPLNFQRPAQHTSYNNHTAVFQNYGSVFAAQNGPPQNYAAVQTFVTHSSTVPTPTVPPTSPVVNQNHAYTQNPAIPMVKSRDTGFNLNIMTNGTSGIKNCINRPYRSNGINVTDWCGVHHLIKKVHVLLNNHQRCIPPSMQSQSKGYNRIRRQLEGDEELKTKLRHLAAKLGVIKSNHGEVNASALSTFQDEVIQPLFLMSSNINNSNGQPKEKEDGLTRIKDNEGTDPFDLVGTRKRCFDLIKEPQETSVSSSYFYPGKEKTTQIEEPQDTTVSNSYFYPGKGEIDLSIPNSKRCKTSDDKAHPCTSETIEQDMNEYSNSELQGQKVYFCGQSKTAMKGDVRPDRDDNIAIRESPENVNCEIRENLNSHMSLDTSRISSTVPPEITDEVPKYIKTEIEENFQPGSPPLENLTKKKLYLCIECREEIESLSDHTFLKRHYAYRILDDNTRTTNYKYKKPIRQKVSLTFIKIIF